MLHAAAPPASRPLESASRSNLVAVSGPPDLLEEAAAGLPEGPARAEAMAARLTRRGVTLEWGEPRAVGNMLEFCRGRGRSSVEMLRADPSLRTVLQIGAWFRCSWRERSSRRFTLVLGGLGRGSRIAADAAFWAGVREVATPDEWKRLTRSSYVALVYHRLAGERKRGQERVDLDPGRFAAQLDFLRKLGFVPLSADEILAFHRDPARTLPPRSFVVTVDDGFLDCVEPLAGHAWLRPLLFVPTAELGGNAHWLGGEAVMGWDDVRRLEAAGVAIGSHGRVHRHLTEIGAEELAADLSGALSDLRTHLDRPRPVLAYPNGKFDERVRRATEATDFELAFSTEKGRNGAGTDPYCLRRVSVHAWDGRLAVLWKVLTGEAVPSWVWLWRRLAARAGRLRATSR